MKCYSIFMSVEAISISDHESIASVCRVALRRSVLPALLICRILITPAAAAEEPVLSPDRPLPFSVPSRISANVEFSLPALAADVNRGIPKRLATFHERIACVHRRVFIFRMNADCDISGYVERTGPISLYGRGESVVGTLSIYGAMTGQRANRFTALVKGDAEARTTVEAVASPRLSRDWSLNLNFSDRFHWNEAPYLHVLGRDISLARYVEPRIRTQLARIAARAAAKARALDLRGRAASAWRKAFEPIELSADPEVWLQITPKSAAFAGVRATADVLRGSIEFSVDAETFVGQAPPAVTPTTLAPLGDDVASPGTFDIILPVKIDYATLRSKIMEVVAAAPKGGTTIRDVQIYPSNGKIVVGLLIGKSTDSDASAGTWFYLFAAPHVDMENQTLGLQDVGGATDAVGRLIGSDLLQQLRQQASISYQGAYQRLLAAANQKLTRPLKDGFRMEGRLVSAQLGNILLLPDGVSIAIKTTGDLKILYGL
jgi:hypothetical protein